MVEGKCRFVIYIIFECFFITYFDRQFGGTRIVDRIVIMVNCSREANFMVIKCLLASKG